MGAYTWLSEYELERYSTVEFDSEINSALKEVRRVMPQWYIHERVELKKSFWGKITRTLRYTVYHRSKPDYEEVRHQISCHDKSTVLNLLYGLYMGYHSGAKTLENEKTT